MGGDTPLETLHLLLGSNAAVPLGEGLLVGELCGLNEVEERPKLCGVVLERGTWEVER